MKRAALCLVAILIMLPIGVKSQEVSDEQTWTDNTLDGDLVVTGQLTIENSLSITSGSTITVRESGNLIINGDLEGPLPSSYARYSGNGETIIAIPTTDFSGPGNVKFSFDNVAVGPQLGSATLTIGSESIQVPENATDLTFTNTDLTQDSINLSINLTLFAVIVDISSITITSDGDPVQILQMWELEHGGLMTWIDHTWSMSVEGNMSMTGKAIGAAIDCSGQCTISNSVLTGSAPIHVNGSLSISNSDIIGSRTDEDITVHDDAILSYSNNNGTGGSTDAWIRLLSSRIVNTGVPGVLLTAEELGYYSSPEVTAVTDEQGIADLAQTEAHRIVAWKDGDGVEHIEEARLEAKLSTPWGSYSTEVETLAHSANISLSLKLPLLDITQLVVEGENAEVDSAVKASITVSNQGTAAATPRIECFANGMEAETSPPIISAPIAAGESVDIEFIWRESEQGESVLECTFLKAEVDGMEAIFATGDWTDSATSGSFEFKDRVEEEDSILPAIILAVLAAAAITGLVLFARKKTLEAEQSKEIDHDIDLPRVREQLEDSDDD